MKKLKEVNFKKGLLFYKNTLEMWRNLFDKFDHLPKYLEDKEFLRIAGVYSDYANIYCYQGILDAFEKGDYSNYSKMYFYNTLVYRIRNIELKNKASSEKELVLIMAMSYLLGIKNDFDFYYECICSNMLGKSKFLACNNDLFPFKNFMMLFYCKVNKVHPLEEFKKFKLDKYEIILEKWDQLKPEDSLFHDLLEYHFMHSGNLKEYNDFDMYGTPFYPLNFLVIEKALKDEGKEVIRPIHPIFQSKLIDFPAHFQLPEQLPAELIKALKLCVEKYGKGFYPLMEDKYLS